MAGNYGIGLGSFMSGFADGARAYAGIQQMKSQQKLNDLRVKEAENDFAERTRQEDLQADANRIGKVGMEAGRVKYGDDIKSVINHYNTQTVPQQQQFWIENGQPEKAEMLGKFLETKQAKQLTESSALAIKQASLGDYANLGPTIEKLMSTSASVMGGENYKLKGMTELKDSKGQKTGGVSFKFAGSDGKDQDISFNTTGELVGFIRNSAMPDKIVEYAYDQEQQALKIRAEQAKQQREWGQKVAEKGLDFRYNTARDENQSSLRQKEQQAASGYRMQEQANQAQLNNAYGTGASGGGRRVAEAEAAAKYLVMMGYTDDEVRNAVPALLGIQNNTKAPAVRIEETMKMLAGSDLKFAKLPAAEQVQRARELIAEIDKVGGSSSSGGEVNNPFQGGGQQQGTGLTPYYDNKTGAIVYR